jgi:hypothetical protein
MASQDQGLLAAIEEVPPIVDADTEAWTLRAR